MEAEKNLSRGFGIFQFCGLLYFPVKSIRKNNLKKYPSIYHTIYFFTLFTLVTSVILVFAFLLATETNESLSARNALNYFMQNSLWVALIVVICVSMIQSYTATPTLKKIVFNCLEISKQCRLSFNHEIDYRAPKINFYIIFFLINLTQVISAGSKSLYENQLNENTSETFVKMVLMSVPGSFLGMIILKFTFFVDILTNQLKHVKIILEKIIMRRSFYGIVHIMQKKSKNDAKNLTEQKLKELIKIYNIIYDNCLHINRAMGLTICLKIFVLVLVLTIGGYRTFLVLMGKYSLEKLGGNVTAIFLATTALTLLVFTCNRVENAVSKFICSN